MSYTPVGLVGYNCKPHPMGPVPQALWGGCHRGSPIYWLVYHGKSQNMNGTSQNMNGKSQNMNGKSPDKMDNN